jgi:hypothetical protein
MEENCGSKMEVKLDIKFEAILGAIFGSKQEAKLVSLQEEKLDAN